MNARSSFSSALLPHTALGTGIRRGWLPLYRDTSFCDIPADESYRFGEQALESLSVDRRHEREAQVQYFGAVSHVDEIVGRLLEAVDEAGKLNNTLVVYTSDHGLNCGHHGIWGKGNATLPLNMLEESIRVPLHLSWPGVFPAGNASQSNW